MPEARFQPGEQHPEEYRRDLNPDAMAGQNVGLVGADAEKQSRTAHDLKAVQRQFVGLTDDELKQIPILDRGTRLQQGAAYLDLNDLDRGEFKALGNMEAGRDNWYVPKSEVDYQLWNRLIGVDNPERLGEADED
jgi:hypothetical protein